MSIPAWVNRYIGIPFADEGFSLSGSNCWGLCHMVLKLERGIETPTYAEIGAFDLLAAAREFKSNALSELWPAVTEPREFDLLLMHAMTEDAKHRTHGHIGIMISPERVLHTWAMTASCHMPIKHPRIRSKIISFHRHRDLS